MIHSNLINNITGLEPEPPVVPDLPDLSDESQPEPPAEVEPGDEQEAGVPTGPDHPKPFKPRKGFRMSLRSLNQKELDNSVYLLITNGPLPHVQDVIAPVGFGPAGLQNLADLLYGWRASRTTTSMKMLTQKQTRQQRDELRRLVEQLVSSFSRTAKAVFDGEESILRFLGLWLPRPSKNGSNGNGTANVEDHDSNGTSARKPKGSDSLTTCVTEARMLFANALELDEVYKQRLAEVGWDVERLTEAAGQVEALAATEGKRKDAVVARRNQQTTTMESERELRDDYKEARELIRVAIDEADLDNKDEFKELIGL